ncbi:hypothetical protein FrEUN1fDRAFT_2416 [Parafrankia sp. EUN1f]|nr:hypothetical protein FrEUN1fDRAFT_2416 [Parafrankia sp. EUN1f]
MARSAARLIGSGDVRADAEMITLGDTIMRLGYSGHLRASQTTRSLAGSLVYGPVATGECRYTPLVWSPYLVNPAMSLTSRAGVIVIAVA